MKWKIRKNNPLHGKRLDDIIEELKSGKFANIAERSGRAQDKEGGGLDIMEPVNRTLEKECKFAGFFCIIK